MFSLHDSVYQEFNEVWDGMVRNEIGVWERFNRYWLSVDVPVMVVRYEDLVWHAPHVLKRLLCFL
ncbi:unnamed protein product, partial [Choristocarpus tenellus]